MKLVENLRSLCASNVLQPMPLPKGVSLSSTGAISSRLKLRTEIDPNRALSYIYSTAHVFDQNVNEFQVYMPENFSGTVAEMDPSTVQLLMLWDRKHKIEHVSLMTHPILCNMSSVVHSVSEQYKKWGVVDAILEQDAAQGLAVSCWSDGPIELEVPEPVVSDCRLSFFLLEPWAFNDDDFQLFTKQTVMNNAPHRRGFVMRDFKDSDRLWGMIYDRCHRLHCRWFVVSTYDSWCFGVFSRGWTSAFVSSPKSGGSRSPTILQCLVYWILSSMDCEGKWDIDEVANEDEEYFARIVPLRLRSGQRAQATRSKIGLSALHTSRASPVRPGNPLGLVAPSSEQPSLRIAPNLTSRLLHDGISPSDVSGAYLRVPDATGPFIARPPTPRNERVAQWRRTISGPGSCASIEEDDVRSQTSGAGPSMTVEDRRRMLVGSTA